MMTATQPRLVVKMPNPIRMGGGGVNSSRSIPSIPDIPESPSRLPSLYGRNSVPIENTRKGFKSSVSPALSHPGDYPGDYLGLGGGLPSLREQTEVNDYFDPRRNPHSPRIKSRRSDVSSKRSLGLDKDMNPEPVPFHPQVFKPSTMFKKVSLPNRHGDMWAGMDFSMPRTKGVALHTDRNNIQFGVNSKGRPNSPNWDDSHSSHISHSTEDQRERHLAELEFLDRSRARRRREVLTQRESQEFVMGGNKVYLNERTDVTSEIQRLKCIALPSKAKELYVGKGFKLPKNHALNNPRGASRSPDYEYEQLEDPSTLHSPEKLKRYNTMPTFVKRHKKREPKIKSSQPATRYTHPLLEIKTHERNPTFITGVMLTPKPDSRVQMPQGEFYANMMGSEQQREGNWSKTHDEPRSQPDDDGTEDNPDERPNDLDMTLQGAPIPAKPVPSVHPQSNASKSVRETPDKPATPNPLKFRPMNIQESEMDEFKSSFRRLDTDADGHLLFRQLKKKLPNELSEAEERYIEKIYNITSASTFFGLDEYVAVSVLCTTLTSLEGAAHEAYQKLNFSTIEDDIRQFTEIYQDIDRALSGKVSMNSLREMLSVKFQKDIPDELFEEIGSTINKNHEDEMQKLDYLAHIPYFITIEQQLRQEPQTGLG